MIHARTAPADECVRAFRPDPEVLEPLTTRGVAAASFILGGRRDGGGWVDSEGFEAFVAARQASLLRTAVLLTGDRHSGEDLLQTVLGNVYVAWPRIRQQEAAEAYVRRALVTTATSWWRSGWRRRETPHGQVPDRARPELPDRLAEASVLAVHLRALPARQRAVLVLRYFDDLSEEQTADLLGCSVGTVKSQAHRALTTLRGRLGQDDRPTLPPRVETAAVPEPGGAA